MFVEKYPLLARLLAICRIENGLDLKQIRGIVQNQKRSAPELAVEIEAAFSDESLRWCELLDSFELGEIYPTENETLARSYAQQMLVSDGT